MLEALVFLPRRDGRYALVAKRATLEEARQSPLGQRKDAIVFVGDLQELRGIMTEDEIKAYCARRARIAVKENGVLTVY